MVCVSAGLKLKWYVGQTGDFAIQGGPHDILCNKQGETFPQKLHPSSSILDTLLTDTVRYRPAAADFFDPSDQ
jgi:hypothetical protein